jgi:hypothetical protein
MSFYKKAERTKGTTFGISAVFVIEDPPLPVPPSQEVWLYRWLLL